MGISFGFWKSIPKYPSEVTLHQRQDVNQKSRSMTARRSPITLGAVEELIQSIEDPKLARVARMKIQGLENVDRHRPRTRMFDSTGPVHRQKPGKSDSGSQHGFGCIPKKCWRIKKRQGPFWLLANPCRKACSLLPSTNKPRKHRSPQQRVKELYPN